jgi:hypothetical protein
VISRRDIDPGRITVKPKLYTMSFHRDLARVIGRNSLESGPWHTNSDGSRVYSHGFTLTGLAFRGDRVIVSGGILD